MQTFLPYPDFRVSAKCLDPKRLGKQRVEAHQILKTLTSGGGWEHHPAVLMWKGYEDALSLYMSEMVVEWVTRGYNNTLPIHVLSHRVKLPVWFGDPKFHASHRSNLLRKDAAWYSKFGWTEPDDLPYVWPVRYERPKEIPIQNGPDPRRIPTR